MAIKYKLTPVDVLKVLGFTKAIAKDELDQFEKENNLKLPALLFDFLSIARNNELFSTADIWAMDDFFPYFSYEYIEEGIEDCRQDWEDDPDFAEQNDFYPFSKIPKEKWSDMVANYLQIGSDYGAGVVFFGIEEKDLIQEDPPVYALHEANPLTDWELLFHSLTDYLMTVILDVLVCVNYNTGQYVLSKEGWGFHNYEYENENVMKEELARKNIDWSAMTKYASCYDISYRCCFNEEEKALYVISNDVTVTIIKAK